MGVRFGSIRLYHIALAFAELCQQTRIAKPYFLTTLSKSEIGFGEFTEPDAACRKSLFAPLSKFSEL